MSAQAAASGSGCGVTLALRLIKGKWTTLVLRELVGGPVRFGELRRRLRGITARALSETLQRMEADDLVIRRFYAEVPPRTEYALSPRAESLMPIFASMAAWAKVDRETAARVPGLEAGTTTEL